MGRPLPEPDAQGQVLLPGTPLDATVAFLDELGFRLASLLPADEPSVAVLEGHGLRLRLGPDQAAGPGTLVLATTDPERDGLEVRAPNGTRVRWELEPERRPLPPFVPQFLVSRAADAGAWHAGRAGMLYRDLVPGRLGGRYVASHLRIPGAGPVPDYVHHHAVHFQLIFCRRGRVRVVYEDQGEPFWLEPGDAVLQPPGIRHRVLESADDLEVVEVGAPAVHATRVDHELELPTVPLRPGRLFGGQRFARHEAARARRKPSALAGFEREDLGLVAASAGRVFATVLQRVRDEGPARLEHGGELLLGFVLDGRATLDAGGGAEHALATDDAFVLPPGRALALSAEPGTRLLVVRSPAVEG